MCLNINVSVTALSSEQVLQMRPGHHAHVVNEILPHAGPCVVDGGFKLVDIVVVDLALGTHSHTVVEGVEAL